MGGPLEDAAAAYQRGNYATALRLWRPLAEQGDAEAQSNLGLMSAEGRGGAVRQLEDVGVRKARRRRRVRGSPLGIQAKKAEPESVQRWIGMDWERPSLNVLKAYINILESGDRPQQDWPTNRAHRTRETTFLKLLL